MNSTPEERTYYGILGVAETCSAEEIQERRRRLLAMLRDGHRGREKQAQEVTKAHRVLSDPAKRSEYDKQLAAKRAAQQFRASSRESVLWRDGLPPWATPDPSRPYTPSPKRSLQDVPPLPETDDDPLLVAVIIALVLMFVLPVVFIHYYYLWLLGVSRVVCGYVGGIGLWAFLVAPIAIAARIFATVGFLAGAGLMAADNRLVRTVGYGNAAAFGFFNTTIVASLVMLGHI